MRHRYPPPYDRDCYGVKFENGHPYVEASLHTDRVVLLTLFSVVAGLPPAPVRWKDGDGGWSIRTGADRLTVALDRGALRVTRADGAGWRVPLRSA